MTSATPVVVWWPNMNSMKCLGCQNVTPGATILLVMTTTIPPPWRDLSVDLMTTSSSGASWRTEKSETRYQSPKGTKWRRGQVPPISRQEIRMQIRKSNGLKLQMEELRSIYIYSVCISLVKLSNCNFRLFCLVWLYIYRHVRIYGKVQKLKSSNFPSWRGPIQVQYRSCRVRWSRRRQRKKNRLYTTYDWDPYSEGGENLLMRNVGHVKRFIRPTPLTRQTQHVEIQPLAQPFVQKPVNELATLPVSELVGILPQESVTKSILETPRHSVVDRVPERGREMDIHTYIHQPRWLKDYVT